MTITCNACSNEFDTVEEAENCNRKGCPYAPKLVPKEDETEKKDETTIVILPPTLPLKKEKGQLKLDLFDSS